MLELAAPVLERLRRGEPVVVATVVGVHGSAPRPVGAAMLVDASGAVVGSVSGGCVEAAVHQAACEMLATVTGPGAGRAPEQGAGQVCGFGYDDELAWTVGLSCGGQVDVALTPLGVTGPVDPGVVRAFELAAAGEAAAVDVVVRGPGAGTVRSAHATDVPTPGDAVRVAVEAAPRCVVVGAADVAGAVSELAAFAGFRVTVVDARATFATPARFPAASEIVVRWPHDHLRAEQDAGRLDARTVVVVLTHDARFDVPAIEAALRSDAGFVGALGARATCARRRDALLRAGLTAAELDRLHAPLGLDLGGRSPQETAVSVLAEVVAWQHGRSGEPLRETSGALHGAVPEAAR
ncbi:XdhC family protein [Luteimicrobium subarcticum]|uniref:Xanthine dehydrogenase accessory factor n=1 Tax=Luteimicrobium subarcticum TaxID=620910 RepID=A0A2M8W1A8_9MICO|nr:XdhC/CoxI family protein [Luteimicrobium subarcticum]PJI84722.1 xanthine dehydrogenase accessory factor [Luteimicrobium subarcticum]